MSRQRGAEIKNTLYIRANKGIHYKMRNSHGFENAIPIGSFDFFHYFVFSSFETLHSGSTWFFMKYEKFKFLYIFYRLPEYKIAGVENFKKLSSKEIEIYPTVSGLESYSKFVEVLIILTWIDFIYIFCGHYITLIQILCSCLLFQLDFKGAYRNNVGTEGKGLKFQKRLRSRLKNCRQGFKIWCYLWRTLWTFTFPLHLRL